MSNVAELPTKDTITLIINRKKVNSVTYVFKNQDGNKIGEYLNKSLIHQLLLFITKNYKST